MIVTTTGDILASGADALVNPVNCVGVMGKGLALAFKEAFPGNFRAYADACRHAEVQPGRILVVATDSTTPPRFILNFPTKRHWRDGSRLEDIDAGLDALATEIRHRGIRSVAVPPLGCGLGGLDWAEVRPRIVAVLGALEGVEIRVYGPAEPAAPRAQQSPPCFRNSAS
jgi:O-acetyl-ADP-ribose deacetylase (regulator of RNase III)